MNNVPPSEKKVNGLENQQLQSKVASMADDRTYTNMRNIYLTEKIQGYMQQYHCSLLAVHLQRFSSHQRCRIRIKEEY